MSRQFSYHEGVATAEHKLHEKVKSAPTTQLVSCITFADGRTLSYEYDAEERITKVTDSVEGITEYTYDALGQLLTETVNGSVVNSMTYDNYGNIINKNGKAYTYGDATWKDLLTGFDGKTIEYDTQGNPTYYLGHNLIWEKGRQLKRFVKSDGTVIDYTYNANGIRTSKTVNGVTHTYTLDGTKILRETWGGNTLIPMYDNEDGVCGILYNDIPYYFVKNLQGDVIAIVDKDGVIVSRYSYDAWGVCTVEYDNIATLVANINPFRYRGYYYDAEIGMYYLQSRYYNPNVGRFVNVDNVETVNSPSFPINSNTYAYCLNNPINSIDIGGNLSAQLIAKIILGIMLGFAVQLLCDCVEFWYKTYVRNLNSQLEPHIADYMSSMFTWATICIVPNSKLVSFLMTFVPIVVKHTWKFLTGDWN